MNAAEKIKAAAAELRPDERYEVFRWRVESTIFKERQLAALKRVIAKGIEVLGGGSYKIYDETSVMQLAEEVSRRGRESEALA